VAEDTVLGKAVLQRVLERIHVVDALAHERAFTEQILIHVRHRARVRIDARFAAIHARVARRDASAHAAAHAGLQDAVAARDPALLLVEARAVERVGQRADELACGITRQAGIGIQGDDVTHIGQHAGIAGDLQEGLAAAAA
jgi:hypothetical protein